MRTRSEVRSSGTIGPFIEERDLDTARLLSLFKQRAPWPVEAAEAGQLILDVEPGVRVSVWTDAEHRLICLGLAFHTRADADRQPLLELCNRINDGAIVVRFSLGADKVLFSDCSLPFEGGICSASILAAVRRLVQISLHALRFNDPDRLVVRRQGTT